MFQLALPRRERPHIFTVSRCLYLSVSTRAPAKGATATAINATPTMACFNSRSREGSDPRPNFTLAERVRFNSRSREGSDNQAICGTCAIKRFNSRSREGSDPLEIMCLFIFVCFNSRSREGSDINIASMSAYISCFNSRSREGSDPGIFIKPSLPTVFQLALPRRERPNL